jgi:hypothetical protein
MVGMRKKKNKYPDLTPLLTCSIAELARRLGRKSYSHVHQMVAGHIEITPKVAAAIHNTDCGIYKWDACELYDPPPGVKRRGIR